MLRCTYTKWYALCLWLWEVLWGHASRDAPCAEQAAWQFTSRYHHLRRSWVSTSHVYFYFFFFFLIIRSAFFNGWWFWLLWYRYIKTNVAFSASIEPDNQAIKDLREFCNSEPVVTTGKYTIADKKCAYQEKKKTSLIITYQNPEWGFFFFFYWFYCVSMFSLQSVQCVHETQFSSSLEGNRCERWDRGDGSTARNEEFLQRLRSFKISIWSWQSFRLTVPCAQ